MSIKIMSAIWEHGPADSSQRFVLLAIADNASDDGGNAYPAVETLAKKCALSERTVIRALDALVKNNYLTRRRRKDTSNMYQIVLSSLVGDNTPPTVSDNLSLTQMTPRHPVSDTMSPTVSDTMSPDPSFLNHPFNHPKDGEGSGAIAPAQPPATSPHFQPVSETVKRQKARVGVREPEPEVIASAPPIIKLLQRLTGYWPGADVAPALVAQFGNSPDEAALTRAVELWRLSGNKPTNWIGIADWYEELLRDPAWTPQARFKNGSGKPEPSKSVSTPAPGSQPLTW